MSKDTVNKFDKAQRGTVEIVGVISGLDRQVGDGTEKFYNKETKNHKKFRKLSFNVNTGKDESTRVNITEFMNETVWASNSENVIKQFEWAKRKKIPEGYRLMSQVSAHDLELKDDGKHKTVYLHGWDMIPHICENFKDGDSVRLRGTIKYTEYNDKLYRDVVITNLFLTGEPVDVLNDEYDPQRRFKQTIVFEEYELDVETKQHLITTRIITNRKNGDNANVVFEIDPSKKAFIKAFKKVSPGTEMLIQGDFYTKAISGVVDMEEIQELDEHGFSQEEGYEDTQAEYTDVAKGFEQFWIIKHVPIKDNDGNLFIHKDKFDIDELDEYKNVIISDKEEKRDNKKPSTKTNSEKKKETDNEWSELGEDSEENWD